MAQLAALGTVVGGFWLLVLCWYFLRSREKRDSYIAYLRSSRFRQRFPATVLFAVMITLSSRHTASYGDSLKLYSVFFAAAIPIVVAWGRYIKRTYPDDYEAMKKGQTFGADNRTKIVVLMILMLAVIGAELAVLTAALNLKY